MPDEFETFFHSAAQQLDNARLADPAQLRAEGDRRRRTRTGVTVAAAALLVAAVVGAGFTLRNNVGEHPAPGASGPVVPSSTPSASPSSPESSPSASTTPNAAAAGGACTAAQLSTPAMVAGEGAAGSAYLELTVVNRGIGDCTLSGVPTLWGTNGGRLVKLPQHPTAGAGASTVLRGGHAATVTIRTANGHPSGVQCHTAVVYQDLLLDLGSGDRYQTGTGLQITCGEAEVGGWNTNLPELCGTANFPQPATVSKMTGGVRIVLTNASSRPCLMATAPALRYTDSAGRSGELAGDTTGGPATVPAHGTAVLTVTATQASGCSPVTYHDVSVQAGTDRLAVPGTIQLPCSGARTEGWSAG